MEITIKINDEIFEEMFKRRLVEDYQIINDSIQALEDRRLNTKLEDYEVEDLVDYRNDKSSFERLLEYYFGTNWRTEIKVED